MKLYENYVDSIRNAIAKEKVVTLGTYDNFEKSYKGFDGTLSGSNYKAQGFSIKPMNSLEPLLKTYGKVNIQEQKLGEHPDFKYLKNSNNSEYHYITSTFIDIKNSTGLFRKYSPNVVMEITNTIQRAAIHTCVIFGGYIQRLQGDGVFVYFGGKGIQKKDSAIAALNATSFFTYFIKNDIKKVFENEGVDDINTRIGIDFGDDEKVLWSVAGIGECSEVTTYSLHTSLASKMQGIANSNGIVVGENVKNISLIDNSYFDWVKDSNGEIKKRYIFEDRENNLYYKALDFDWFCYLKNLPNINQSDNGELYYNPEKKLIENDRINLLRRTAGLISSGDAYTNKYGELSNNPDDVKNQEHRFHYGEKNKNTRSQV